MNVPFEIRLMLAVAGRLLPCSLRLEWSREWLAEFSHAFRGRVQRRGMFVRAAGAIPDAWTLLQECGIKRRLSEAAHSRMTTVVLPALMFFILTLSTLRKPLPNGRGSECLVSILSRDRQGAVSTIYKSGSPSSSSISMTSCKFLFSSSKV